MLVETLVHLNHEHVSSCFSKIHCGHFLLPVLVRNLIIFEYSKIIFKQTPSNRLMPTVYFEATKQTFSIDCGTLGPSSHMLIKNEINCCAWLAIKFTLVANLLNTKKPSLKRPGLINRFKITKIRNRKILVFLDKGLRL